ncbi:MAG: nucleotide exchange factor GrpE [Clostridiales bacterium]|nr:nucleotide exchange factor GrpE [Clostridiales bacterium]
MDQMSGKKPFEQSKDKEDINKNEELAPEAVEEMSTEAEKRAELLERMTKEAHKLAEELATEKDRCMRVMAEYDNFRKRSQKERENIYSDVRADTILKLLPVYDNLERALKAETEDEAYRKGVEMTMDQFKEILEKMGVAEIDAKTGDKFDPTIHDAVMHVDDDSLGEGVVVEEFQKGFRLGDKVIRFSVVKVAN